MQESSTKPMQKFISFFKNKFNIFKNKIIPKSRQQHNTSRDANIDASLDNNIPIYTSSVSSSTNIKNNTNTNTNTNTNNIKVTETKTKIETDIITITTTMTTVTTIHNTRTHEILQEPESKLNNDHAQFIDKTKYTQYTISSLLDNIIDDIEVQEYVRTKKNNEQYKLKYHEFYDSQQNYAYLKNILKPYIFTEFDEIVRKILTPDSRFLAKLYQLKIYSGDLIDNFTRHGVFETNNFIIKIDDDSDIFMSEFELMYHIGKGLILPYNIVLPYYIRCIPNNINKVMNFSIQPRIKNTTPLHKWLNMYNNKCYNITYYIKMCITISKSILFIHSHNIVHGDIKPDNILVNISDNTPYIIDFGLSGIHSLSQGTGGTRPFCCPETKNTSFNNDAGYIWIKNKKHYDLWSIAFIFSSIIIFKKAYNYYDDYPDNYFTKDMYINPQFLNRIPLPFRDPFILVLSQKSEINLSQFIRLLEDAIIP